MGIRLEMILLFEEALYISFAAVGIESEIALVLRVQKKHIHLIANFFDILDQERL